MLIYIFGSRDGLLAQVVARMESEQRALLAGLATGNGTIFDVARAFWERVTAPDILPVQRLFFEIYGLDLLLTGERAQVDAAMELFAAMVRDELD
jgi:hypothetical protein